jgi:flavin reductase ActVB
MTENALDPADFRNAMSTFASGVTIVTTTQDGRGPAGFTASAFNSLSLNPPLVIVCLDRGADCFSAFEVATHFGLSILAHGQDAIAKLFATRGADKFGGTPTVAGVATGMPLVPGAIAQVECRMHSRLDGGDHLILVGEVIHANSADVEPLLHYNRKFGHFAEG